MKRITRIIAILLAVTLLTGCSGLTDFLTSGPELRSNGLSTFDSVKYTRPDMDAIRTQFEKTVAMHSDGSSMKKLTDELQNCWLMYLDFYTMDTVAEVRSYQDVTDPFYADENAFCMEAEAEIEQLLEQLQIAGANCEKAEELEKEFWGEGLIDTYAGVESGTYDDNFVALVQRESELLTSYRSELAGATVPFGGKERLYSELCSDSSLTETQLTEINEAYYDKYSEILGKIYIDLVAVRQEMSDYLGYDSYEEYAYDYVYERDYTPQQAQKLLDDIRAELAPVYREAAEAECRDNVSYDTMSEAATLSMVGDTAEALGGSIAESFDFMKRHKLYDIRISEKKAEISFETYLDSYDVPFVLVKTYGWNDDCLSLAHEFGHFTDAYVNYNATQSLDLCEVFSLSMEYLLLCNAPSRKLGDLANIKLLNTLDTFVQQASFAAFEKAVYEMPAEELTVQKLNDLSLQCATDYGYFDEGRKDYYAKSWIDIAHFFEYPFYVVSYCVSSDVAFQIYQRELANKGDGLAQYNLLLPRDHAGFLETLSEQSDLESPFAAGRMKKTAQTVRELLWG